MNYTERWHCCWKHKLNIYALFLSTGGKHETSDLSPYRETQQKCLYIHQNVYNIELKERLAKVAQWSRALAALLEDLSSVSSTHMQAHSHL